MRQSGAVEDMLRREAATVERAPAQEAKEKNSKTTPVTAGASPSCTCYIIRTHRCRCDWCRSGRCPFCAVGPCVRCGEHGGVCDCKGVL
jgi:hypothetical protein